MSYILDALRKSEEERKRGDLPNPADFSQAVPDSVKPSLLVPILVAGLIALNLVVLLIWAPWKEAPDTRLGAPANTSELPTKPGKTTPVAPAVSQPPAAAQAESTSESSLNASSGQPNKPASQPGSLKESLSSSSSSSNSPTLKSAKMPDELPVASSNPSKSVTPKSEPIINEDTAETLITPKITRKQTQAPVTPIEPEPTYRKPETHYIPQLQELPSRIQQNIPDLSFSSHMYSSLPRFRSITINGRRLKEGQFLNENIGVQEITEKGVIMSYDGQFFEVDVLGRWGN